MARESNRRRLEAVPQRSTSRGAAERSADLAAEIRAGERAHRFGAALVAMARELAALQRENAGLRRENEALRDKLGEAAEQAQPSGRRFTGPRA
jgi:hypothetical protein